MAGKTAQIPKLAQAAEYLTERQGEVLPEGFRMQKITCHILDDANDPEGTYAEVEFSWIDGQYNFTVAG